MRKTQVRWNNPRPVLTVLALESKSYGRCYHGTTYKVTSTRKLDKDTLHAMYVGGIFGPGQEFNILSETQGVDSVGPVVEDTTTGNVIEGMPAINEYTGQEYENINMPYFEYRVERRVDSGD